MPQHLPCSRDWARCSRLLPCRELRRHLRWADTAATAWHFRRAVGQEVDLVLETPDQRIVGAEVKASASITQGDFSGLRELASAAGKDFVRGVVFYTGEQLMPFDEHLWAVPLGVLWAGGGGGVIGPLRLRAGGAYGRWHLLGRPGHAGRDQAPRCRCAHELVLHHQRSGQRQPVKRRCERRAHRLRRQHDDRHAACQPSTVSLSGLLGRGRAAAAPVLVMTPYRPANVDAADRRRAGRWIIQQSPSGRSLICPRFLAAIPLDE